MERYRISESVGRRVEAVHSYGDLEIHHPTANRVGVATGRSEDFEHPRRRAYGRVDGAFEELRREPDGRVLVKKDFILTRDPAGPVHVPAPVAGYVHYLHDPTAAVRIYDRPYGTPGAMLLAQSLHMDRSSFRIREGGRVEYGQPLGRMSDTGTPGAIHAHVEAEPDQFRRYIRDIANGTIGPDRWPAKSRTGDDSRTPDTGTPAPIRNTALEPGDVGPRVRELQRSLNRLGVRDAQGLPLLEDGDFGRRTREAVQAFQREHDLPDAGRVGPRTQAALAAQHGPRISDPRHADHELFTQVLGKLQAMEATRGLPSGPHSMNVAAALLVQMRQDGVERVDRVELNDSSRLVRVVQSSRSGLHEHELATVPIDAGQASMRSLHASSDALAELARAHARQVDAPARVETMAPAPVR
jgi:peptidoglycan hydrolase-like protein with peptidoglycan-binding domain